VCREGVFTCKKREVKKEEVTQRSHCPADHHTHTAIQLRLFRAQNPAQD